MNSRNRRQFLAGTAAVSAGMLAPGARAAESKASKKPPLKIGIMTYNIARNWDIETIIKNCTEAKFLHVELRTTHAHKVEVDLSAAQRSEVKKRFEDSPIEAISLASGFSYHHPDPAVLRKNIEGTKKYTLLARDIGARGIRVFPNQFPVKGVPEEKTLEQIGKAAAECADFASDYGVQIRLANHGRGTNRVTVVRRILDHAQCKHLYVNWNCDMSDIEGPGFDANFNLVKDRIGNIHLHSMYNEKYPYRRLFELLRLNNYKGYCNAEILESSEPVRLMKYYRALFLAYQNVI